MIWSGQWRGTGIQWLGNSMSVVTSPLSSTLHWPSNGPNESTRADYTSPMHRTSRCLGGTEHIEGGRIWGFHGSSCACSHHAAAEERTRRRGRSPPRSCGGWKCMKPMCVVLVINDNNPYGLMVALSCIYRVVHSQCWTICWLQGCNKKQVKKIK
jgi:hypothetical protein